MPDARDLLSRLADEVGDVEPPVDLLLRGRSRHRRRVLGATSGAALAVVAVVAAALLVPVHPHPAATAVAVPREATAAALAAGSWTVGPASPLGARDGATLTWTGKEVLEVGGGDGDPGAPTGAAYDPAARSWRALPPLPGGARVRTGSQLWLGDQLFVFPVSITALGSMQEPDRAALYSPSQDRWTVAGPSPFSRPDDEVAVVVGKRVLVIAATGGSSLEAAWYDPTGNTWTRADPPAIASHGAYGQLSTVRLAAVNTTDGVLLWALWSGFDPALSGGVLPGGGGAATRSGVDVFRLTDRWSKVTGTWPQSETVGRPQLVGGRVLLTGTELWCGVCPGPYTPGGPGRLVDPATLAATTLPVGPLDAARPSVTSTGASLLALDPDTQVSTQDGLSVIQEDLAVLDLRSGSWYRAAPAPLPVASLTPVWTGARLVTLAGDGRVLSFRARP